MYEQRYNTIIWSSFFVRETKANGAQLFKASLAKMKSLIEDSLSLTGVRKSIAIRCFCQKIAVQKVLTFFSIKKRTFFAYSTFEILSLVN